MNEEKPEKGDQEQPTEAGAPAESSSAGDNTEPAKVSPVDAEEAKPETNADADGKPCPFGSFFKQPVCPVHAVIIVTFILSLAGYWGFLGWPADLVSHFKLQYALVLLVCLIIVAIKKRPQWILVAVLGLGMNVAELMPAYIADEDAGQPLPHFVAQFKVMQMNVHTENTQYDKAVDAIRQMDPDVISLNEVDQKWLDGLKPALNTYKYHVEQPRDDNFGIAVYSRIPLAKTKIHYFTKGAPPVALVALKYGHQIITVLSMHTMPPISETGFSLRNDELFKIAEERMKLGQHLIVVGDLNTTPYSPTFKEFLNYTGLRDSRAGFGIQGSWPSFLPPLWIPIDHILVSEDFMVLSRKVGPYTGSDHFPVMAEVGLLPAPAPPAGIPMGPDAKGMMPGRPIQPIPNPGAAMQDQ